MKFEHSEQVQFVARVRAFAPDVFIFAIANGGFRNPKEAARLKNEGVTAGVPDLMIAVARGHYHGLFVEMKRARGGRVSPAQKVVIAKLREAGYMVEVCAGVEEAWQCYCDYMGLNDQ